MINSSGLFRRSGRLFRQKPLQYCRRRPAGQGSAPGNSAHQIIGGPAVFAVFQRPAPAFSPRSKDRSSPSTLCLPELALYCGFATCSFLVEMRRCFADQSGCQKKWYTHRYGGAVPRGALEFFKVFIARVFPELVSRPSPIIPSSVLTIAANSVHESLQPEPSALPAEGPAHAGPQPPSKYPVTRHAASI